MCIMFQAAFLCVQFFAQLQNTKTIGHIFPVLGVKLPKCMRYMDKSRFYPVSRSLKKGWATNLNFHEGTAPWRGRDQLQLMISVC
jgi:hypothetical protein